MAKLRLLVLSLAFSVGASAVCASVSHSASDVDLKKRCETKREAKSCFELGFSELKKKGGDHRRAAARYLKLACSIQTKKSKCSGKEAKRVARAFLAGSKNRIPAAASQKAPIRAPKITPSKSGGPAPYQPPPMPEPPRPSDFPAPAPAPEQLMAPPPPPPPPPQMDPAMQMPQAIDPSVMQGGCQPGDPTCDSSQQIFR